MGRIFRLIAWVFKTVPRWIINHVKGIFRIKDDPYNASISIVAMSAYLLSFFSGMLGLIMYHVNGGYQGASMYDNFKEVGLEEALKISFDTEAVAYMRDSVLVTLIVLMAVAQIVMAIIGFFLDKDTRVGSVIGFAIFTVFNQVAILPFLMLAFQNPKNTVQAIGCIILTIVLFVIMVGMAFGALSGAGDDSGSSYSSSDSTNTVSKETKKAMERKDYLEKKHKGYAHALNEHYKGSWNYSYIRPEAQISDMRDMEREIDMLNKQIQKGA